MPFRIAVVRCFAVASCFSFPGFALAERPEAAKLLPASTLAYIRVDDTRQFIDSFQQTGYGRLTQDPQIRALISQFYSSLVESSAQVEEALGVSLEQLISLPEGELCAALIAPETGRLAVAAFIDVPEQRLETARKVLAGADNLLQRRGSRRRTQIWREATLVIYTNVDDPDRQLVLFELDGTMVIASNADVAKQIVDRWQGYQPDDDQPLADDQNFQTVIRSSPSARDQQAQLTCYVDPIELARAWTRDNLAAQAGLAMLPALGLDGIDAIGGSLHMALEELDSIAQIHLLLDNPRAGVVKMVAFRSGDPTPEDWVPADVESYATFRWDVERSYRTLEDLYDGFRGENALSEAVNRRLSDQLGIDFQGDFLEQLEGRFALVTWIEPSAKIDSQVHLLAAKLKDPDAMRTTLERIAEQQAGQIEVKQFGGTTYYLGQPQQRRRQRRQQQDEADQSTLRTSRPCFLVLGDDFLFTENEMFVEHLIITDGNVEFRLANEPGFQEIQERVKSQSPDKKPSYVAYRQPQKTLEMYYEFLTSEETRRTLESRAERNRGMKLLLDALNAHPLPPLDSLLKYLSPSGALLIDDDTGLHYTTFSLRSD